MNKSPLGDLGVKIPEINFWLPFGYEGTDYKISTT
jgi:hypothetical protein